MGKFRVSDVDEARAMLGMGYGWQCQRVRGRFHIGTAIESQKDVFADEKYRWKLLIDTQGDEQYACCDRKVWVPIAALLTVGETRRRRVRIAGLDRAEKAMDRSETRGWMKGVSIGVEELVEGDVIDGPGWASPYVWAWGSRSEQERVLFYLLRDGEFRLVYRR